ncbi:hypothetical protein [Glutamicibacter sp. V16R2B1]|uniref:hypothetical protein n=1 Tax=Glutamicibacter sp. V16R2B1 TaxID=2036207 RepID=UPI0010FE5787|nr:hypothetical protein [Glutamicibacter sp. V16R2B1]TLK56284.1 hypothetical protein FDN03_02205 [Glutamicibacter sp. V16R2B1]
MARSITTDEGTTVTLTDGKVFLTHPEAPVDMRGIQAGRAVCHGQGFQPAPLFPGALRPSVLRAIADLIENTKES